MTELIGYCAAGLTTLAFVPQLLKTWRSQSSTDLSLSMMAAFTAGVALWLIYGFTIGSAPIVIANATTLVLNLLLISCKLRQHYRSGSSH